MRKRSVAAILFAAFLCVAPNAHALSDAGDVNGSGEVTAADAAMALRAVYGLAALDNASSITADVTGDMTVSVADVSAVLLYSVGRVLAFSDIKIPKDSILGERNLEAFSYGGRVETETSYLSDRVAVTLDTVEAENALCRVADVYVHEISSFATAFSGGEYLNPDSLARTEEIAADRGAILAVNGDFYSQSSRGLVVRGGVWYREKPNLKTDVCVLYTDGTLRCFAAGKADRASVDALGTPWQSWSCGPSLLDENGAALKYFTKITTLSRRTMRTAIGYYEPGHYCLIAVEGRANTASSGMMVSVPCSRALRRQVSRVSRELSESAAKMPPVCSRRTPCAAKSLSQSKSSGRSCAAAVFARSEMPTALRTPKPLSVKLMPFRTVLPMPS